MDKKISIKVNESILEKFKKMLLPKIALCQILLKQQPLNI
jgi:hypothetical protein